MVSTILKLGAQIQFIRVLVLSLTALLGQNARICNIIPWAPWVEE